MDLAYIRNFLQVITSVVINTSITWGKLFPMSIFIATVKPVLRGHVKIDKAMILMTYGSLMKVESIAECSERAFCNTFDLH